MTPIPKAKKVRLTDEDLDAAIKCGNCKAPIEGYGAERTFAFEVVDGDGVRYLFCSTTCKTFVYGTTDHPRRRSMTEYKKVPTNTAAQGHPNPVLAKSMGMAIPDIEAMEKRGQQELLDSHVLPTRFNFCTREQFEALGFTFGEVVPDDPIFQTATLPPGWKREATDHTMWTQLVDERGITRVKVFYKAAWYDRSAHMHLVDVGAELGGHVIYGKHPPQWEVLGPMLDRLTPAEIASFTHTLREQAEAYAKQSIAPNPRYLANLEAATAILNARAAR